VYFIFKYFKAVVMLLPVLKVFLVTSEGNMDTSQKSQQPLHKQHIGVHLLHDC